MERQDTDMTFNTFNFFTAIQLLCDIRKYIGTIPEKQQLKDIIQEMDRLVESARF